MAKKQPAPPLSVGTFIKAKGYADVLAGILIAVKPAMLYESPPMQFLHSVTGLHLSDASTAPGFNHAIACMVIAVGFGNIVAGRSGPAAWPSVFAATLVWGALSLLTVLSAFWDVTKGWEVANATMVMTAFNHFMTCTVIWYMDRGIWSRVLG